MIERYIFDSFNGVDYYATKISDGDEYVEILDLGGTVSKLVVKDKFGNKKDVVLGYDTIEEYMTNGGYFCALIGRFGNRIEKGKLVIDGVEYSLYLNDKGNHLHGGKVGFNKKIWKAETDGEKLVLSTFSPDMEENYPGNLNVKVVYTFKNGELNIEYTAVSDKKTALNLTNHAYFNLAGEGNGDILGHFLKIDADTITPTDEKLIPHGEFRKVENTPFDFRKFACVGDGDKQKEDRDIKFGGGYDHCFVFDKNRDVSKPVASAYEDGSGISLDVYTDMPAVQFYAGNYVNQYGKGKKHYGRCYGFCLETQNIPNNVNVEEYAKYGNSIIEANTVFHSFTKYAFGIKK